MILECPECHKRFQVADAALVPAGRTVRCGVCSHSWHVDAPPSADGKTPAGVADSPSFAEAVAMEMDAASDAAEPAIAAEATPKAPEATDQSSAKARKTITIPVQPFKIAAPVLAAVWVTLAYLTYLPHFSHSALEGLEFSEVRMEPKIEGEKTSFVLFGGIVNHGANARVIPSVRVTLRTAAGDAIWQREYPVNKPLKAGAVYPFKIANVDTARGADVAIVALDMGNAALLRAR